MLRKRQRQGAAKTNESPVGRNAGNGGEADAAEAPQPTTAMIAEQLKADREWAAARFAEVLERLERVEAELKRQAEGRPLTGEDVGRRRKSKEGMSRQQVLAVRVQKQRARRASRLKAQREDRSTADEEASS